MDSPEDNTTVLRMQKDFDEFISHGKSASKHSGKLSYGGSFLDQSRSRTESAFGGVSMKEILEKTEEDKQKKRELIQAKSQISKLHSDLVNSETTRKRAKLEFEAELDTMKQGHERELEKYSDLKHQLHVNKMKESELREEFYTYKKAAELAKATYEQKLLTLQKEKNKLEATSQESEQDMRQKISNLKSETLRQQTELQICRDELEERSQQLAQLRQRYFDTSKRLENMEEEAMKSVKSEHRIKELEQKLARISEDAVVASALKSDISQIPELRKENMKLKQDNSYFLETQENILLLKEQAETWKAKLERSEERCLELQQKQIEFDDMKKRLEKWQSVNIEGINRPQSPTKLLSDIADLQNSSAVLLEQKGQLTSLTNSYQRQLQQKVHQLNQTQQELQKEQVKVQQHTEQMRRLQKKLILITKERDGYKSIIDSYESEVTLNLDKGMSQRTAQLEQINQGYHQQLNELERELESKAEQMLGLKQKISHLERQLADSGQSIVTKHESLEVDQKLVISLREKIADLEKTVEKVTEEKDILVARLQRCDAQGDYDPTKTKVLHLSMNPYSMAQAQRGKKLAQLQTENSRLRKRLEVLEQEGEVADLTAVVDQKMTEPTTSKELDDVKQQLNSAELKNQRLMEAFKKTSQEFREVCYQLLGYKIDIPSSNQYRLMSMYAESPEDYLLFQQAQNGDIQLLGTEFSQQLEDKLETYLHGANSIPVFLSSVTMDLFNKQTMMVE